ncbi:hypothetical protein [Methylobacterium trifolii]|uniref:Uncharacterized protein n=1 Tax=Methylobacterium trifolii TaxID=1003092 RepID=A0ABQ4TYW8_9HYPH|nr:hypothetical protein [Methylobacterium trifolii]GJE59928.1 hypothetical protein MPOCJGCO_2035 [Methylobacterium trifolii]
MDMERLHRALSTRDSDWRSVAFAYTSIVIGAGLVIYSVVAQQ